VLGRYNLVRRAGGGDRSVSRESTFAYQIVGAWDEDGKGCRSGTYIRRHARKIKNDYTGDAANAHYHRYQEDVALEDRVHKKLEEWRVCPGNLPVLGGAGTGVYSRVRRLSRRQLRTVRWHGGCAGDCASEH
jgi:Glycosyl hydrolase family 1